MPLYLSSLTTDRDFDRAWFRRALGCSKGDIHGFGDVVIHLREEVAVAVVRHLDRAVAHADLHRLGVGVGEVDRQGDSRVAKIVDPEPIESGCSGRWQPEVVPESATPERLTGLS